MSLREQVPKHLIVERFATLGPRTVQGGRYRNQDTEQNCEMCQNSLRIGT